ncbi:hypothetical protein WJX72_005914 [[Myrmecia] bisecta]|uniref:Pachytene checkpoint protein 2 homolog n=1 Tax=[Myrmecia] bisecta TaxID=41462 RepID=A0AAW1PXQ6_9CHLO
MRLPGEEPFLDSNVESITVCDTDLSSSIPVGCRLLFWQLALQTHVFQLSEEGAADAEQSGDNVPSYREWALPAREFHQQWESLVYDSTIKQRLVKYASTALLFSDRGVNSQLISWNRVVLLHGPPGTGKTSLCQALAQKLAIRFGHRYQQAQLVEVNAHSLFSKWFSESGKLVSALFAKITELVEEDDSLVFVLIDEVESLTAARKSAVSGNEPADAIRAVNALLTQLDALRRFPNVMILTTSNITEAIDLAFVDRADIKAYIGPPPLQARYEIMRSSIAELQRAGIITGTVLPVRFSEVCWDEMQASQVMEDEESSSTAAAQALSKALAEAANACEGFSGRALRKLPFLAHADSDLTGPCTTEQFLAAMRAAALREAQDRSCMADDKPAAPG